MSLVHVNVVAEIQSVIVSSSDVGIALGFLNMVFEHTGYRSIDRIWWLNFPGNSVVRRKLMGLKV